MAPIFLYGVSTNWFPLVYPLIGVIGISYGMTMFFKYRRRKILYRENKIIKDLKSNHRDAGNAGTQ